MSTNTQTRRDFIKLAAGATAFSLISHRVNAATRTRSIGANDRVRIGIIGCGSRGIGTEMANVNKNAKTENLEVIAVCDPWSVAREKASAQAKEWFGTDAKQCRTVAELLEMKDVDAVSISCCDHWHATYSAEGGFNRDGSIRGENKVEPIEQTDHWVNWFRCMRDGKTPNAPLDAGYQHAIASIMATMSCESGRRTRFDANSRKVMFD
jgi:hypothetical protein